MTESEKRVVLKLLKVGMTALFSVLEPTEKLKCAVSSDFRHFSHSEAYELLRYLLVASGVNLDIDPKFLSRIDTVYWKSMHHDSKTNIEKYKIDILQSLKDIFQTYNIKNMGLRKSDLISPNNLKYMKCSFLLADIALNCQLKTFGIELPLKLDIVSDEEFSSIYNIFKEQEEELEECNKALQSRIKESIEDLGQIGVEIGNMKEMKQNLDFILESEMKKISPPRHLNDLSIANTLASWTQEIDEMSEHNNNYFKDLKMFDKILNILINLDKKVIIDGKELAGLVSSEMLSFAEKNRAGLLNNNVFNVSALLKIVLMALSAPSEPLLNVSKLFELNVPSYEEELVEKLKATEDKIKHSVQKFCCSVVNSMAIENAEECMNNKFPVISGIQFLVQHKLNSVVTCNPFIDIEKLDRAIMMYN